MYSSMYLFVHKDKCNIKRFEFLSPDLEVVLSQGGEVINDIFIYAITTLAIMTVPVPHIVMPIDGDAGFSAIFFDAFQESSDC